MKLISKYKDYYDYLTGIYGIDEKLVYDRTLTPFRLKDFFLRLKADFDYPVVLTFAINSLLHHIVYYKGVFYYTPEELVLLNQEVDKDRKLRRTGTYHGFTPENFRKEAYNTLKKAEAYFNNKEGRATDVNKILRQPALLKTSLSGHFTCKKQNWSIPLLSDFPITKYISAEEVYQEISAFLGWLNDHPEIENNQTDKEKLVTHGFDPKQSFRHRK